MRSGHTIRSSGLSFALPVWIWIGAIFCASSIPGPALDRVGIGIADKLAHAMEYAVLGFLVYRQQRRQFGRSVVVGIGIAWLSAFAVGGVDELYQGLISGRDSDWADWIADGAGGLGGALTAAIYLLRAPISKEGSDAP